MMMIRVSFIILMAGLLTSCFNSSDSYAPVVRLGVSPQKAPSVYRVKRGDTLYSIAWQYGLDYRQVAKRNKLSSSYAIWPGQSLQLAKAQMRPIHKSFKVHKGDWAWPTKGSIIQGFKPGLTGNAGIDIAGKLGQTVRAAAPGVVVYSGNGVRGYGNLIIIRTSSDFLSAYAYNRRNLVRVGSRIHRGQPIAVMGRNNAGHAALHFEIRYDGQPVDPIRYLS